MADPFYYRNVIQLRAVPDFIGTMNQSNDNCDGFIVDAGRITNEYGFLNSHSFKMTSGNKFKSGDKLANTLISPDTLASSQYDYFTFEARIRLTSLAANVFLFEFPATASGNAKRYGISTAGKLVYYSGTTAILTQTDPLILTTGVDYHIAFVRAPGLANPGQRILMFVNGIMVFDGSTTTVPIPSSFKGFPTVIGGSYYNNTNDMVGYMDDIRISKFPRYTANFTPPTNADFTVPVDPTWLPLRPGFQSKTVTILDDSLNLQINSPRENNYLIGTYNLDSIKSQVPLMYDYYGSNDIKGIAQIDGIPTPNVTLYLLHRASKRVVRITKSKADGSYIFPNIQSGITFMILGEDQIGKSLVVRRNAYVRDFVRFNLPGEGISNILLKITKPTGTFTANTFSDDFNIELKNSSDATIVTLSEDNYRKDIYRDNLSLYIDCQYNNNSNIIDISAKNKTVNKYKSANLLIDSSIHGNSLLSFISSGDYLEILDNLDDFCFPGDFTIEVDFITSKTNCVILDRSNGGVLGYYILRITGDGKLYWEFGAGTLTSTTTVTDGVLKKVAISRINGLIRLFINGIKETETINNINLSPSPLSVPGLIIGGWYYNRNSSQDFIGKIGKIRITKGIGRFTSNYTPDELFKLQFNPSAILLTPEEPLGTFKIKSPTAGDYYFKTNNNKNLLNPITDSITFT